MATANLTTTNANVQAWAVPANWADSGSSVVGANVSGGTTQTANNVDLVPSGTAYYYLPTSGTAWFNDLNLLPGTDFNGTSWASGSGSVVRSTGRPDPDGGSNAFKLTPNTTNTYQAYAQSPVAIIAGQSIIFQVIAKANGNGAMYLACLSGGNYADCWYDLTNGTLPSSPYASTAVGFTANSGAMISLGGGWYICQLKFANAVNATTLNCQVVPAKDNGGGSYSVSYAGNAVNGIDVYKPQLNYGSVTRPHTANLTSAAVYSCSFTVGTTPSFAITWTPAPINETLSFGVTAGISDAAKGTFPRSVAMPVSAGVAASGVVPGAGTTTYNEQLSFGITATIKCVGAGGEVGTAPADFSPAPAIQRVAQDKVLIELQAATDAAGTLGKFYVSTGSFVTLPSDTPPNQAFDNRLDNPGEIGVSAYGDGRTGGGTRLELGEVTLTNADGRYDGWRRYGFDGRPVTFRFGSSGAYPADFPAVLVGTIESVAADFDALTIRLRDRQFVFDQPVLTLKYAGTNSLPNGLEGTADDLKGKPKPMALGRLGRSGVGGNISPPCINTSKLTFEPHHGALQAISAVYDRGVALTFEADVANSTLLQAATVASGKYQTCLAEGLFRLGSAPTGTISCDVVQGAAASNRTVAQLLKALALLADPTITVSAADITALDAAAPAEVGVWISGDETYAKVMDDIAASIGAYYAFDATGTLRIGRLAAPTGNPVVSIGQADLLDQDLAIRAPRDNASPVWSVTVRHSKNWTVQSSDVASSVAQARRTRLALDYLTSAPAEDATVKTQFLLAETMSVDTLLADVADADAEAARLLALHKVRRDIVDVPVPLSVLTENALKLMDEVEIVLDRFGFDDGKTFRLIGIRMDLGGSMAILSLWG